MKKMIFILLAGVLCGKSFSQAPYTFMYEKGWSAVSGAENFIAANYLYGKLDEKYIPVNIFGEKRTAGKIGNIAYRLAKTALIDIQLNAWAFIAQHEYFGHTIRAKQAGFYDAYPVIGFPYKFGQPYAVLNSPHYSFSIYELKLIDAGGIEANTTISRRMLPKILIEGKMLNQQSIFFFHNNIFLSFEIIVTKDIFNTTGKNDLHHYNRRISYLKDDEKVNKMFNTFAWIDLFASPVNFVALYSLFNNYIIKGKHVTKIPMIKITNGIYYLPEYRFNLAPYSPESVYENYLKFSDKLLKVSFRHSVLTEDLSFGFDFKLFNYKIMKRVAFDTEFAVWRQRKMSVHSTTLRYNIVNPSLSGFAVINTFRYTAGKKNNFSLVADLGYKSGGYLEGEILDKGLILRGGLGFNFE